MKARIVVVVERTLGKMLKTLSGMRR
jgi:hypothetical protein